MHNPNVQPIGVYEKAFPAECSWDERLSQAARAGYDFVEISIDDTGERLGRLDWSASTRLALRHAMENTGVPLLTMGLSAHRKYPLGSASLELRTRGLKILSDAICLASDLGIRIIQLMGYDVFYESSTADTRMRFVDGLQQGAAWASSAGIMLGLENVDVETVDSVEKALHFVRAVNSPWLNVYPDMGNVVAAGFDPVEQLILAKDRLIGLHVKDARPREVRGVPFGHGLVDFSKVFLTLAEMGFCGPLVVEMWAHLDTSGDPLRAAAEARQFVGRFCQSSGEWKENH